MRKTPLELPADVRAHAAANYGLFVAHIRAGFTEDQALYLVGCATLAAAGKG